MRELTNVEIIKLSADTEVSPTTVRKWSRGNRRVQHMAHNVLSAAALARGYATQEELTAHAALVLKGAK